MTNVTAPALAAPRSELPRQIGLALSLVLAIALPFLGNNYVTYMAALILINVIATVGLNITVGYAGLLSMGHAAFMGVGIPMLMVKLGRDPALGSSVLITAVTDSGGFFIFLGLATIFLL